MVLTHRLWANLGANRNIVGSEVRLQGRPFTVIGVLPRDFTFLRTEAAAPPQRVDAFVPFERPLDEANPRNGEFTALIRARPGTSPPQVAAAVGAVGRVIDARDFEGRGLKLYPTGLKAEVIGRIRPVLIVLGASGLVLLIMLTVNLGSVLLARAASREHEFAVSRALGANEAAVARSTLLEGGLLGLAGGTLGAIVAAWGTRALVALAPLDLPRREALELDWSIALIVAATGAALGALAATPPAVWAARASLSTLLAASAVRGGGGHGRLRRSMVVAQVALSLILLATGALVTRSFERLLRADPGFRPEGLLTVRLRTPPEFFPTMSDALAFQDRVQKALAAIPGVTGASATASLPLTGNAFQSMISMPGAPENTGDTSRDMVLADFIGVRADYMEVMNMRLRSGGGLTERSAANEVVIDTAIAQRFFGGRDPVGARLQMGGRIFTVAGVVDQARQYDVHSNGRPQVYVRSADFNIRPLFYVIRSTRDPQNLMPDIRAAVRRLDARVPVGEPKPMQDIVDATRSPQLIGASLIGIFAAGALLLAAMGLFGVVSGSVTRRRHELAVRLALGAEHSRVLRLVMKEGALLVLTGLLIGAPGIYVATQVTRGLLVGVSPSDPMALFAAAHCLLLVTILTCYFSARRVLRIEPSQLLRND
jgi:putative ABC transport system permease protein